MTWLALTANRANSCRRVLSLGEFLDRPLDGGDLRLAGPDAFSKGGDCVGIRVVAQAEGDWANESLLRTVTIVRTPIVPESALEHVGADLLGESCPHHGTIVAAREFTSVVVVKENRLDPADGVIHEIEHVAESAVPLMPRSHQGVSSGRDYCDGKKCG